MINCMGEKIEDSANGMLQNIIRKCFPEIKEVTFDLRWYENGCLCDRFIWDYCNVSEYFNVHFEETLQRLLNAFDKKILSIQEEPYAENLVAGIASSFFMKYGRNSWDELPVVCAFYTGNDKFCKILNNFAFYCQGLITKLFTYALKYQNEKLLKQLLEVCSMQWRNQKEKWPDFISMLSHELEYIGHESGLPLWSEEYCERYFELCEYIDIMLPELNFRMNSTYNYFRIKRMGIAELNAIQSLYDSIQSGIFWEDVSALPEIIEVFYKYPSGKNGDVLRYLLEEFGETRQIEGLTWKGAVSKRYISVFELFYSSIPLPITEGETFEKIYQYHIPTIMDKKMGESVMIKANCFDRFRTFRDCLTKYGKKQTQLRGEVYSKLVIEGKSTPKWKSETQLFTLVSAIFPDTIYQFRTDWLLTQSIDIYIPSLHVGIEYQGKQHYEPVEYFGGNEHFIRQKNNDKKKKKLCEEHEITLIEWPYYKEISENSVKEMLRRYTEP